MPASIPPRPRRVSRIPFALCLGVMAASVLSAAPPLEEDSPPEPETTSLVCELVGVPGRNIFIIDYDDSYLFVGRHHGNADDAGGPTEPGLFVHSRRARRWLLIREVSTRGARFGKTTSRDPDEQRRLDQLSVGWDLTSLAAHPRVALPLQTGGSLLLPDRVDYDADRQQYRLRFASELEIPVAETVLWIDRAALERAFSTSRAEQDESRCRGKPAGDQSARR